MEGLKTQIILPVSLIELPAVGFKEACSYALVQLFEHQLICYSICNENNIFLKCENSAQYNLWEVLQVSVQEC